VILATREHRLKRHDLTALQAEVRREQVRVECQGDPTRAREPGRIERQPV